jgi:hypothetical protein
VTRGAALTQLVGHRRRADHLAAPLARLQAEADRVWAGFSSQHWTYRRRGLTIAVLTNLETPGGVNPAQEVFKALGQVALGP